MLPHYPTLSSNMCTRLTHQGIASEEHRARRVQVPNNHVRSQNLHILQLLLSTSQLPTVIVGYLDPQGNTMAIACSVSNCHCSSGLGDPNVQMLCSFGEVSYHWVLGPLGELLHVGFMCLWGRSCLSWWEWKQEEQGKEKKEKKEHK